MPHLAGSASPTPWPVPGAFDEASGRTAVSDTTWLEPDDERPQRDRRRLRLAALAVIPWLIVAGLLVLPRTTAGPDAADEETAGVHAEHADGQPADAADGTAATPAGRQDPAPPAEAGRIDDGVRSSPGGVSPSAGASSLPEAVEIRGRWRLHAGVEEAASLGLVVARAALTGLAPVLTVDGVSAGGHDRYAEHLVVEAVEQTGVEAVTVTVVAI